MIVDVVIPYSPDHTPHSLLSRAIDSIEEQGVETDIHVIVDSEQNGPAWARNKGINQSSSRYVAFCDADDYWESGKLSLQLETIQNEEAGICLTQTADTESGETFVSPFVDTEQFVKDVFLGKSRSFTSSILIDTSQIEVRFDEEIYRREDHLFALEAAARAGSCFVNRELVRINKHQGGLSSREERELFIKAQETFYEKATSIAPELEKYSSEFWSEIYHHSGRYYYFNSDYQRSVKFLRKSLEEEIRIKTMVGLCISYIYIILHCVKKCTKPSKMESPPFR